MISFYGALVRFLGGQQNGSPTSYNIDIKVVRNALAVAGALVAVSVYASSMAMAPMQIKEIHAVNSIQDNRIIALEFEDKNQKENSERMRETLQSLDRKIDILLQRSR